jgi:apolipoprotein N-acyltransferase
MIGITLSLFSAILLTLSFPKFDLGFLAWIALVPLLFVLRNSSPKFACLFSWLTGTGFFLGVFFWITYVRGVTWLHFSIMGLYLGLYFLIFGLLSNIISKKSKIPFIIAAPALFVATEYLRLNAGFAAQPMNLLAYTQHSNLPLIQMSSFTGVYGVSFIIVLANAAFADLLAYCIEKRRRVQSSEPRVSRYNPVYGGIAALLLISSVWLGGWIVLLLQESDGQPLSVAVVQGNIPSEIKWAREYREQIISKYEKLSEEVSKARPALIVWPEASTPGFVLKDMALLQRIIRMVKEFNAYMLIGSAEYPKFSKTQLLKEKSGNTALFFSPEGKFLSQYLKIYLIPFGEYVPFEGIVPWPEFIVTPSSNSNIAGEEATLFEINGGKFGTLICSEIIYPELSRWMVKKGAGFLVNISNEGWFGKSAFSYQFLALSVFRAVENRVNVVRSTNTGISSFIDPYGRIIARLTNGGEDVFIEGTLTRDILLSSPGAFYTVYGDIFAYVCIGFSLGLLIWSFFKRNSGNPNSKYQDSLGGYKLA